MDNTDAPTTFASVLEIRGAKTEKNNAPWAKFNFVLEKQRFIPYELDGNQEKYGSLKIGGARIVKVPPHKADGKPFPLKILISGAKFLLNALSEEQREEVILVLKLAAADVQWCNPFVGNDQFQFETYLQIKHQKQKNSWFVCKILLHDQNLAILECSGRYPMNISVSIAESSIMKLWPLDADDHPYAFEIVSKQRKNHYRYQFNAASEVLREKCILLLRYAAADPLWENQLPDHINATALDYSPPSSKEGGVASQEKSTSHPKPYSSTPRRRVKELGIHNVSSPSSTVSAVFEVCLAIREVKTGAWHRRLFVLHNQELTVYDVDDASHVCHKGKLRIAGASCIHMDESVATAQRQHCFQLNCTSNAPPHMNCYNCVDSNQNKDSVGNNDVPAGDYDVDSKVVFTCVCSANDECMSKVCVELLNKAATDPNWSVHTTHTPN